MSGIGAVTPAKTKLPVEGHQPPEGDGGSGRREASQAEV